MSPKDKKNARSKTVTEKKNAHGKSASEKKSAAVKKAAIDKKSAAEKRPLPEKKAAPEKTAVPEIDFAAELKAAKKSIYINRELSWLAFNERVLLEAADPAVPLLERLKFLMIYQSNLTEFYRVRIGILSHRILLAPDKPDPLSGMLPETILREVLRVTNEQQTLMESIWKSIREELRANGVDVLDFKKISKVDELMSKKLFGDIKDLLFPKIIELNQPFPFLWSGESHVIAFLGRTTVQKLALIPMHRVPAYLSFEINGTQKIVLTTQLVRHFLPLLLKKENLNVLQSATVEVTRNADVFLSDVVDRSSDDDFRVKVSSMLTKRKREMPVRARIYGKLSDYNRALLVKKLHVPERCVFTQTVPFDLSFRSCIGGHEGFKYEDRRPSRDIGLKKGEYFSYIEKHDLLMSFPFQSMMPFVDLIYEAADDPEVLSIKITLYRMSGSSKIAAALAYAADKGKDVLCLLELRARFDEQNNIDYSEMLEDAGCRVIYGLPDHKVHSKLCVITRQHNGNLSRITQVGTGNYNEVTGEQYTDLSLITAKEEAGLDAEDVFTALLNGELPPEAHCLWVAPNSFKTRVLEFLDREKEKPGRARQDREHYGHERRRPLARAFAHLQLRRRGGAAPVHRLGRSAQPQPRAPRRGLHGGRDARHARADQHRA